MDLALNLYNKEIASLKLASTVNTNTDSEFDANTVIDVKVDYEGVNVDGSLSIDSNIKTINSVEVPTITDENSTDLVKSGALDSIMTALSSMMGGRTSSLYNTNPYSSYNNIYDTTDLFNTNTNSLNDLYNTNTLTDLYNTNTLTDLYNTNTLTDLYNTNTLTDLYNTNTLTDLYNTNTFNF